MNAEENKAKEGIADLFRGPRHWNVLLQPEAQAMTIHGRALAFRMAARAGAGLKQLLIH